MIDEQVSPFLAAARRYWHPVARSADVAVGAVLGPTVCGVPVALWRGADGNIGAVVDRCPHRGTKLSLGWVGSGGIACPYHAWEFAPDGGCVAIPQAPGLPIPRRAVARAVAVVERYGLVWAYVGSSPVTPDLPELPEAEDPSTHVYAGEPVVWACAASRQIENFCDVAHFSVVHDDTFGNPDQLMLGRYEVTSERRPPEQGGRGIRALLDYEGYDRTHGRENPTPICFEYRIALPFAVWLGTTYGHGPDARSGVLFCVTRPISDVESCVYWLSCQPAVGPPDDAELQRYETMIFEADRRLIESQDPAAAPLDPGAEVHLPFDKLAVAYRRALVELGFAGERNP